MELLVVFLSFQVTKDLSTGVRELGVVWLVPSRGCGCELGAPQAGHPQVARTPRLAIDRRGRLSPRRPNWRPDPARMATRPDWMGDPGPKWSSPIDSQVLKWWGPGFVVNP